MSALELGKARQATVRDVGLADGRTIRVRLWPGIGLPVVLLHGLLDSSEGWDDFARETQQRCVAFDLPGHGGSSRAGAPRLEAYASDVVETLDRLEIAEVILVGHSLGGAIAAAVADRAPERVAGLGLIAPAGFGRIHLAELVSLPLMRNAVAATLPLALRSRVALTTAYMTMVTAGRRPADGVLDRVRSHAWDAVPGARDATEAIVAAGAAGDAFHKRQLAYRGPVSVIWGRHDRLVPIAHLRGVERALPQAETDVGSFGHHPHRECRDRLWTFLERLCETTAFPLATTTPPAAERAAAVASVHRPAAAFAA